METNDAALSLALLDRHVAAVATGMTLVTIPFYITYRMLLLPARNPGGFVA